MSGTGAREYHTERARIELDMARRAKRSKAASAHMRLSSLHMSALACGHTPRRNRSPFGLN